MYKVVWYKKTGRQGRFHVLLTTRVAAYTLYDNLVPLTGDVDYVELYESGNLVQSKGDINAISHVSNLLRERSANK